MSSGCPATLMPSTSATMSPACTSPLRAAGPPGTTPSTTSVLSPWSNTRLMPMPQSYSLDAGTWDAGSWATSGLQYRSLSVVGSYGSPFECPGYGSVRLPAVRGSMFAAPPAGRPSTILTIAVSGRPAPGCGQMRVELSRVTWIHWQVHAEFHQRHCLRERERSLLALGHSRPTWQKPSSACFESQLPSFTTRS